VLNLNSENGIQAFDCQHAKKGVGVCLRQLFMDAFNLISFKS